MSVGDFFGGLFGGKNEYDPNRDKYKVDDNAYNYGGRPNGAADAAASAERTSNDYNAQARYATDQAYGDRNNAGAARAEQGNAMAMMKARASGAVPSAAQMQGQRDMEAARAGQASAAAGARGPGALALAQQNAAANTAAAQQNISGQSQVNAMNERERAESAYMGAATGMRQQDYAGAQQAAGMSGQFQNTAQGYAGLQNNIQQSQLNAGMNRESQKSANANAVMGIKAGVSGQNAGSAQQWGMGAVNMGSSVAGGIAGMAGKAEGGPVNAGQPYVMGELGPELVVPAPNPAEMMATGQRAGAAVGGLVRSLGGAGANQPLGGMYDVSQPGGTTKLGSDAKGRQGMDVMGSLKANSDFGTKFVSHAGASPIAREKGGPVPPGKPVLVGEKGPEIVVPTQPGHVLTAEQTRAVLSPGDLVASTWGAPAEKEQRAAASAHEAVQRADMASRASDTGESVADRENRQNSAGGARMLGQQIGTTIFEGSPPSGVGSDVSKGVEDTGVKMDRKGKKDGAAQDAARKKMSVGELVASGIEKGSARMLDGGASGYRPMSTYQAPQLLSAGIPLSGTREGGGPVDAGKAYLVGEKGPEMMKPAAAKESPEDLKKWAENELSRVQGAKVAPSNDERWARDEIERLQASQSAAPAVGDSERWARDEIDRLNASKDAPAAVGQLEAPGAWAQSEIDRLKAGRAAAPAVQPRPEEEEQRFMLSQILRGRR